LRIGATIDALDGNKPTYAAFIRQQTYLRGIYNVMYVTRYHIEE